jgi:multiple sugar transport system permease protein
VAGARTERAARWIVWALLVVVVLGPIYWIVASSLKGPSEIIQQVPTPWPAQPYLGNYEALFSSTAYVTYLNNSLVVAVATAAVTLFVAVLASFAMYRLRVRGSRWLGTTVLLSYMIPGTLLLVPIYDVLAAARLIDTLAALVIINVAFASPFCVWMLRGFFDSIPRELDEAAAADGAGPLTILWKVDLPLLAPGLGTVALYSFIYSWTEFVFASQLIASDGLKTLPIGLSAIMGQYNINWGLLMAGASLTMVPPAILFAVVGRYFVRGLTTGAIQ